MAIYNTSSAGLRLDEQNEIVVKWASMVQKNLRGNTVILQKGKDGTIQRPASKPERTEKKLEDSILSLTREENGIKNRVSIRFERHGVFVHKGVGRGYPIKGGMVQKSTKSLTNIMKNKNMSVHAKINARAEVASVKRKPFDWFNSTLDNVLPELANKLAEINADAVFNAAKMMIK